MAEDIKPDEIPAPFIVDDEGVEPLMDEILDEHLPHEGLETELARGRAALQMSHMRNEIALLKIRVQIISERAKAAVTAQTTYVSASAHAQLGDYPWAKLFAASCVAYIAGRLMRRQL